MRETQEHSERESRQVVGTAWGRNSNGAQLPEARM